MKNNTTKMSALRHVDIVVNSLEDSLVFYKELLGQLGWEEENTIEGERGETLVYLAGPEGFSSDAIGLRQRQSHERKTPYDRYDLGLHHVAINASTRWEVDKCAKWLKDEGYEIEDGPAEFYNENYYAVFFYDPDGIKLEIVCGS